MPDKPVISYIPPECESKPTLSFVPVEVRGHDVPKNIFYTRRYFVPTPIEYINIESLAKPTTIMHTPSPTTSGVKIQAKVKDKDKLLEFLHVWNDLGGRPHVNPNTKVLQRSMSLLRQLVIEGTFYNDKSGFQASSYNDHKFTLSEWKTALENFNKALTDPNYYPRKKDSLKVSLPDFLWNPYCHGTSSKFLYYLENNPEPVKEIISVPNLYPDLTRALTRAYSHRLLGDARLKFGREDCIEFIRAANMLGAWYEENKDKFTIRMLPLTLAQHLIDAIMDDLPESKKYSVMPYWLKTERSLLNLSKYLVKQALMGNNNIPEDRVGMQVD